MNDQNRLRPTVVPSTSADDRLGIVRNVPGNYFDKHGSRNPLVKWLMGRFHDGLATQIEPLKPGSILDVGCGEGRTTQFVAEHVASIVGVELEADLLGEARDRVPSAHFVGGSAYALPFKDEAFDVVIATEVLEHLHDPQGALVELTRVARRAVIITVPHEPWWRMANVMRGRYLRQAGNTPGHINHWSLRGLRRELTGFPVDGVRSVGLWIFATIRLGL